MIPQINHPTVQGLMNPIRDYWDRGEKRGREEGEREGRRKRGREEGEREGRRGMMRSKEREVIVIIIVL